MAVVKVLLLLLMSAVRHTSGCNFYPVGEYLRFVRIPENLKVGDEVLQVEVHPRKNLVLQAVDKEEDAHLFTYRDVNRTHVAVLLAQSLDHLVDRDTPQNVVKFRLGCDFHTGDDLISAYLSVTVYIEDVNDNSPRFLDLPYRVTVDELTPPGLTIFKGIRAFDRDKPNTPNSEVEYSITGGDPAGRFALEGPHKPGLVLAKSIDYDAGDREFLLTITASDRGSPPRSSNATVHVIVMDNDDLPPKFTLDVYRTKIPEFYPILGKRIHKELVFEQAVRAFDQDAGVGAPLRYRLVAGDTRRFSLGPLNATLFLDAEIDLDAESLPGNTLVLVVQAEQVGEARRAARARIEVELLDLNDNLPDFEVDFYNISIVENLPNGFSVLQVMATDKDQGENAEFSYQLSDPEGAFSIDPKSGWLTVRNQTVLDREQHSSLRMKVYAKEKNPSVFGTFLDKQRLSKWRRNPPTSTLPKEKTTYVYPDKIGTKSENIEYFEDINQFMSFVTVEVTLLDANDNNPVFVPSNLYEFSVKSNAKIGTFIGNVKAVDPDLGRNGIVSYDLQRTSNLTITSPFQVDAHSGEVTVAQTPILEGRHALFVEASDQPANPSERRYSLAVVTVDVTRSSTDKPDFVGAPYEFWVGSNVGIGTSVGQIRVNEAMEKSDVSYDLLHGYEEGVPFAVEERSGVITVIHELSKFNRLMYDFEAVAIQEGVDLNIATNATIHVVDADDERGFLLKGTQSPITFHVKENLVGAMIGQIFNMNSSSVATNKTANIRYIIANQQDVSDDIAIGQDGTIYAQKSLDREKRDSYRMTVIAEFNKGIVSGAGIYQVNIFVDDENDNPPVFDNPIYEGVITENAKKGTEVKMTNKIRATDADVGLNAVFSYTLFGDGHDLFSVNELSGVVTYVGNKLDREERSSYLLKVVARDKGSLKSEAKVTITVLDENDNEPKYNQIIIPLGESVDLLEIHGRTDVKIFKEKKNDVNSGVAKIEVKPKNKFSTTVDATGPLFLVPENIAIGSTILKLNAVDMDSGVNGQVRYEFMSEVFIPPTALSGNALQVRRYFVINERHGHIVVARALPPEAEFRLNVSAIDGGGLIDHITIRIFVKDINDHFPMFKKSWYSFNVDEAQYSRRVLGKVDATDADFGQNANLTYFLQPDSKDLPFEISPLNGVLSINGELDREKEDKYILTVVARDNGYEKKLTSSVSVEIEVLDVNDNAPKFYAYDELLEWKHPEADNISNHNFESVMMIPVYKTTLEENTPIGSVVTRVYANDSDLVSNGNGLILYSLPQRKNQMNIFSIDSKEGIITTTARLDYESQSVYNVTVVASDLGSPSLSSTAIVMLTVKDVPDEIEISDKPVFISRYYELEIEENVHTPVELVTLNLTEHYENFKMRYFILNENDTDIRRTFVIDPRNGTLYLVRSPDREVKDVYEVLVRAERQKISREMPHMIYPVSDDVLEGMTKYDVKIVVRIKDVNDNAPKFINGGRPMVTAIPTTAPFGYEVIKLQAVDADAGVNADIRYQLMSSCGGRFAVSARGGAVRAAASVARDKGKVFGFDVKATDRAGADDGRSAIANVFVYVLDESQQLILAVDAKPTEVEKEMENITRSLSNMTGYDIRVRRFEPSFKGSMDGHATDLYIYGVDPLSNSLIDMDVLQKLLVRRESAQRSVGGYKLLRVGASSGAQTRAALLTPVQLGVVALACLVLVAACAAAGCVLCRNNTRKRHKSYSQQRLNAFSTEHLTKFSGLFPSGGNQCQEINQSYSEPDSYIDLNHSTLKATCPHGIAAEEFGKAHQKCVKNQFGENSDLFSHKHERMCIKYNQRPLQKRKGQDTSITSVNSSGQDSGIAEAGRCACGHSPTHTSEESSGEFRLVLRPDPSSVFAEDVQFHSSAGPLQYNTAQVYSGKLEDDDTSHVYGVITADGLFDGTIWTTAEEYYVEPVSRYNIEHPSMHSVIYRRSDVQHPPRAEGQPCASHLLHLKRTLGHHAELFNFTHHSNADDTHIHNNTDDLMTEVHRRKKRWLPEDEMQDDQPMKNPDLPLDLDVPYTSNSDPFDKFSTRKPKTKIDKSNLITKVRLDSEETRPKPKTHVEVIKTKAGVVTVSKDVVKKEPMGYTVLTANATDDGRHVNKRATVDPRKTTCLVYLQADHMFYQRYGSEEACIEVMTRHVQKVNAIYKVTDFNQDGKADNITFMIKRIKVHTLDALKDPAYRFPNNYGVEKYLELFSEEDYDAFCLAYMFTYRDFEMGTLGLAWTGDLKNAGGVCEKNGHYRGSMKSLNTGIVTLLNYGKHVPPAVSHVTLAHEIGHNFGSPHDPEMCTPFGEDGNYIMFARATSGDRKNNNKFSPCSLRAIDPVLNNKARSPKGCFTEPQPAICGNGVVEEGEECDCGWASECTDVCCRPQAARPHYKPCTLTEHSVCSPSQGPCCTASCTLKFGDKCRSDNGCRDAAHCDGRRAACPASRHKPNRTRCDKELVCFMGECTGSICLAYGLESCQCGARADDPRSACELCCRAPGGPCRSSFHWNTPPYDVPDMYAKPGTPCNDYNGYCDVFQRCREVDPSGPLATLRKLLLSDESLAGFRRWVLRHWYAVLLILLAVIALLFASTRFLGRHGKKLKSVTIIHSSTTETVRLPDAADQGLIVHTAVRSKLPLKKKVALRTRAYRIKKDHQNKQGDKASPSYNANKKRKPNALSKPEEGHKVIKESAAVVTNSDGKSPKHILLSKHKGKVKKRKAKVKSATIDYSSMQKHPASPVKDSEALSKVQKWLLSSPQPTAIPKSKSIPLGLTERTSRQVAKGARKTRPSKSATNLLSGEKARLQVVFKPPFRFSLKICKSDKTKVVLDKSSKPDVDRKRHDPTQQLTSADLGKANAIKPKHTTSAKTSVDNTTNSTNSDKTQCQDKTVHGYENLLPRSASDCKLGKKLPDAKHRNGHKKSNSVGQKRETTESRQNLISQDDGDNCHVYENVLVSDKDGFVPRSCSMPRRQPAAIARQASHGHLPRAQPRHAAGAARARTASNDLEHFYNVIDTLRRDNAGDTNTTSSSGSSRHDTKSRPSKSSRQNSLVERARATPIDDKMRRQSSEAELAQTKPEGSRGFQLVVGKDKLKRQMSDNELSRSRLHLAMPMSAGAEPRQAFCWSKRASLDCESSLPAARQRSKPKPTYTFGELKNTVPNATDSNDGIHISPEDFLKIIDN